MTAATTARIYVPTETSGLLWPPADAARSAYEQLPPTPALGDLVACFHLGLERIPRDAPVEERVLPDGTVHLAFNFGDPPVDGNGTAFDGEAMGATLAPALVRMVGRMEQVGVRLRPGGVAQLLGVPAGELAERRVPLELLWGARAAEVHERLLALPDGRSRAALLAAILRERLGRDGPRPHAGAAAAVRLIRASGGRLRVREVAAAVGVGERRLEQLFHVHVGVSPKAACRLARFNAAVQLAQRQPAVAWSDVAYRCGYSDQSHLVNDFRAFAGLTPGAFRTSALFGFFQDGGAADG